MAQHNLAWMPTLSYDTQAVLATDNVLIVLLDDVGLQADALRDDVSKRRRIEREHFLQRVSFELLEK